MTTTELSGPGLVSSYVVFFVAVEVTGSAAGTLAPLSAEKASSVGAVCGRITLRP